MLEVAIDLRYGPEQKTVGALEKPGKAAGDIIIARLTTSKIEWGEMEKKQSVGAAIVVAHPDDEPWQYTSCKPIFCAQ